MAKGVRKQAKKRLATLVDKEEGQTSRAKVLRKFPQVLRQLGPKTAAEDRQLTKEELRRQGVISKKQSKKRRRA